MEETYMNQTGDGKYLFYFTLHYLRFPIDLTRLVQICDSKSAHEVLSLTSYLDEIEFSIISEPVLRHGGLDFHSKNFYFPWLTLAEGNPYGFHYVPVDEVSYNFITCDGNSSPINFYSYLQPFKPEVWSMIVICVLGTALVMLVMLRLLNYFAIPPNSELSLTSILLTITALLLDNEVYAGQMSRAKSLRGFMTVWIFSALVLNTAPVTGKRRTSDPLKSHFGFNFGKWIKVRLDETAYSAFKTSVWDSTYNYSVLENYDFDNKKDKMIAKLFRRIHPVFKPDHDDVIKLISGCNKTAFVDDDFTISETLSKIHGGQGNHKRFYSGEETIFKTFQIWFSSKKAGSYLYRRCQYYVSSGIHYFWRGLFTRNLRDQLMLSEGANSLSLNSNLVTIFYILIGGCLLSSVCWLYEIKCGFGPTIHHNRSIKVTKDLDFSMLIAVKSNHIPG
ncbi:unnamed protein product [Orchesella dallaii]|uniref:Uncharacterized protein n=1 Tax=Orchesella dallaii TaxID=48710 RepID=A0ABP1QDH8_9HEXA